MGSLLQSGEEPGISGHGEVGCGHASLASLGLRGTGPLEGRDGCGLGGLVMDLVDELAREGRNHGQGR